MKVTVRVGHGNNRGSRKPLGDLIDSVYLGKCVCFDNENRTELLRLLFDIIKPTHELDGNDIKRLRGFLRRFKLTRAETHGIVLHLGYQYKATGSGCNQKMMNNIKLDGYHEQHKREVTL